MPWPASGLMGIAISNLATTPSRTSTPAGASDASTRPASSADNDSGGRSGGASSTVTLSPQTTLALSAQTNASANYYAQFFPTRDGKPATALGLAVTNPGAVSSSGGKPLAQVGKDARASLDAKYAEFKASGSPFDINSWEGKDVYSLFGDLDRRSLYAVSSNEGGQFTDLEQKLAQSTLGQEAGLASGFYRGPTRLDAAYVPPPGITSASVDPIGVKAAAGRANALVKYLDGVSDDEKTSISWAYGRASAQLSYESAKEDAGETPDNLESPNLLARLIADALKSMKHNLARGMTYGSITGDLKRQPWFQGFESKLNALLSQDKNRPVRTGLDVIV